MEDKIFSGIDELPVYTEGVLDVLLQADINLGATIGCSAGAMNGR